MKKKILIIGNTSGLPGVPVDMLSYYSFFTSPVGGNWCCEEIDIMKNPTRCSLYKKIVEIEKADYDYVITIYVGHGCEAVSGTVLIINGQDETVEMNDLTNLSQRQLLIFDCCRSYVEQPFDIEARATKLSLSRDPIRRAYEDRIQASSPQEIVLFACDHAEEAYSTVDGGEYSQHLLHATQMALIDSHSPFISVSRAHYKAVSSMRQDGLFMLQHPQILQSRCSMQRCLPLAINPNFL